MRVLFAVSEGEKQPNQVGKTSEIRKNFNFDIVITFFWKINKFPSFSLEFQVLSLGFLQFFFYNIIFATIAFTALGLQQKPVFAILVTSLCIHNRDF